MEVELMTNRPTEPVLRIEPQHDAEQPDSKASDEREIVLDVLDVSVFYGTFRAVRNITIPIRRNEITALIGPSGCGKTTLLRSMNRMNDLIEDARVDGRIMYHGVDLYGASVDPVEVRRRIGMVFL
jgi:phosphate transport system ATP-binding protein